MGIKCFVNNPIQENTYVVWDEVSREAAVVDCGALTEGERERMREWVREKELRVVRLLNTHLHFDHCLGNGWAAQEFGVKPEAHKADEPYVARFEEQLAAFGLPFKVKGEPVGRFLNDGDVVCVGGEKLEVIHTPGHTPGGVCFYNAKAGWVLTGDTLFCGSVGRADLQGGCYTDLIRSIRTRLMALPDETRVYCGHGPYTTIGDERRDNPFL